MFPAMNKFASNIWIGPLADGINEVKMREHGITAIANLTGYPMGMAEAGFKELVIEQEDGDEIPAENIAKFIGWMADRYNEGDVIYIHCAAGISRTPSFLIAWLLHTVNAYGPDADLRGLWSAFEDGIGACRSCIQPHWRLKKSILEYFASRVSTPGVSGIANRNQ